MSSILDALNKLEEEKAHADALDELSVHIDSDRAAIRALTANVIAGREIAWKPIAIIIGIMFFAIATITLTVWATANALGGKEVQQAAAPDPGPAPLMEFAPLPAPDRIERESIVEGPAPVDEPEAQAPVKNEPPAVVQPQNLLVEPDPEPEPEPASPEVVESAANDSNTVPVEAEPLRPQQSNESPVDVLFERQPEDAPAQETPDPVRETREAETHETPVEPTVVANNEESIGSSARLEELRRRLRETVDRRQQTESSRTTQSAITEAEANLDASVDVEELPLFSPSVAARLGLDGLVLNWPQPKSANRPVASALINRIKFLVGDQLEFVVDGKVFETGVLLADVRQNGVVLEVISTGERYYFEQ